MTSYPVPTSSPSSLQSLQVTWAYSKLMCWQPAYAIHIIFAYATIIFGVLAFGCRLHPTLNRLHVWMGRMYVICMLWSMGSSLIIFNTGLPLFVVYSFLSVLGGLSVGLIAITVHQERRTKHQKAVTAEQLITTSQQQLKGQWENLKDKMLSWKSLHGIAMTISWFSLAGRGFATGRRFYDFECFTYPAYKTAAALHLNSTLPDNMLLPVPEDDPAFLQLVFSGRETFFGFVWLFAPMLSAFVIGCAYVMIQHKRLAAQHRYQLVNL